MLKTIIKKLSLFIVYAFIGIYLLFLICPLILNPFLSKYSEQISKFAEENSGLKIKIEKLQIITTPKLSVGVKIGYLSASIPNGEEFLSIENTKAKLSLIPLIYGRIEGDNFSIDNIDVTLKIKPDGSLEVADYLPESKDDDTKEQLTELPMGLKLSNKMPNIYVKEYFLSTVDMKNNKTYSLQGGNLRITDFVVNKSIKVSTVGTISLENQEQFKYDIKISNYIMPDIDLNNFLLTQNTSSSANNDKTLQEATGKPISFNIFDILSGIKQNGLTAYAKLDIIVSGKPDNPNIKGLLNIDKLSMLLNNKKLPDGHINLQFKNNKANTDIKLFTEENEITTIIGKLVHGKQPNIDLTINSNASINNIFELLKVIAKSFNYNDLNTLSATGKIDADFTVKSNLKTLNSSGHLNIPSATIKYGLYNLFVDKIKADVDLNNNNLNIKNIGFTILQQPLKLSGTVTSDAQADLHLTANKLLIKGLVAIAGQLNLLKENDIKSGTLSMDANIKGHLTKISPLINLTLDNINILNKPSNTTLKLNSADVKLSTNNKTYNGNITAKTLNILNPAANFNLPIIKLTLNENDINIDDTYLLFNNSRFDITGSIKNYSNKDITMNFNTKGNLVTNDIKSFIPKEYLNMMSFKGSVPIIANITGNNKTQTINLQLLATPNGYVHIADLLSVKNKSMLINSKVNINGNTLTFENTGAYATNANKLSDNLTSNITGTQILKISGGISDFNDIKLNSINISTPEEQTISVPSFTNSNAKAQLNITLNGKVTSPDMHGSISLSSVTLPTIKTTLKNITIDLGKTITANLPSIVISDSNMSTKALINNDFSKGIIINHLDFSSTKFNSDTLIAELAKLQTNSGNSNGSSDIGIIIKNGKGNINKFITGKIIATDLTSDFNLKNNIFTLKDLMGKAYNGNINGTISCNLINGNSSVTMNGENMKAVEAIAATAGIPNALSGTLKFNTKLTLNAFAPDFNKLLKSVKGHLNFTVKDGNYINIGTLDQFIFAGNIATNAMLKTVMIPIKKMPVVQNSSQFTTISGQIDLNNGIATLTPVTSTGNSVAYYVTGTYNLLNGYTNVNILGRMGADVVAALGPLGQLSANKLTTYLPKFGTQTLNLLKALTSNPKQEKIELIPALANGNTNYKDFKVIFNGNITNPTSVKTFKWLSECDISGIENGSLKEQLQTSVNTIKQEAQNNINETRKNIEETKQNIEKTRTEMNNKVEEVKTQVQKTKDNIEELKKLKDSLKNSIKNPPSQTTTQPKVNTTTETKTGTSSTDNTNTENSSTKSE